jgi:hypothetical protein
MDEMGVRMRSEGRSWERGDRSQVHGVGWENAFLRGNRQSCLSGMLNPVGQGDVKLRGAFGVSTQTAAPSFQHRDTGTPVTAWQSQILALKTGGSASSGGVLPVAEAPWECVSSGMNIRLACMLGAFAAFALPLAAQEPEVDPGEPKGIPADLLDDPHVREELAVNEFTAPSISKLFDTLQFLMPLPILETELKLPERMPMDRADLAIELGFLIADGFLVVQAEQLDKVEDLAKELTRYGKALGAGDRVNRHAAGLLESAKNKNVAQLKKELSSTQRDVETELVILRDADLAHLISLGGWIRALQVSTVAVDKQFSEERARKVMREDIADYYTESVAGLEPRISERPNYREMRDLLAGLRTEMILNDGEQPTPEKMKEIREQAAKLVELALQRNQ